MSLHKILRHAGGKLVKDKEVSSGASAEPVMQIPQVPGCDASSEQLVTVTQSVPTPDLLGKAIKMRITADEQHVRAQCADDVPHGRNNLA